MKKGGQNERRLLLGEDRAVKHWKHAISILRLPNVNYKSGGLSGTRIRAALPTELVHQPGTMKYSGSIRRNNERLLSRRQLAVSQEDW